jgi:hypothetical protein
MEFLRLAKRRTLVSELVYVLLNVGLAAALLVVVWVVESPLPAFAVVLLSKWRVLAVRPRYWFAHIQANLVDLIVSFGLVVLLYTASAGGTGEGMAVQIVLTLLYVAWLLLLKPRTKRAYVIAQAGVALAVGTIALFSLSYGWPSSAVVIAMFVLGYSTARHVLSAYSDNSLTMMSLIWGYVTAQIGWLTYHWLVAYDIPFTDTIKLPQATIIIIALSFLAERIYNSYAKHGAVRSGDVLLPALLSFGVVAVIIFVFNGVSTGSI